MYQNTLMRSSLINFQKCTFKVELSLILHRDATSRLKHGMHYLDVFGFDSLYFDMYGLIFMLSICVSVFAIFDQQ